MDIQDIDGHIIYTGDTSSLEFIKYLLSVKEDIPLAFADPPYNAHVAAWDENFTWRHDYLTDFADIVAVTPGMASIKDFMRLTSMSYQWSMSYFINNGLTHGAIGFANWIYVALFGQGSIYRAKQDCKTISIYRRDALKYPHKGQKPLAMMRHIIELFTEEGDIVLDPFMGSGSTLIACHDLGRRCITGDISELFVEQAIERYCDYTSVSTLHRRVSKFKGWNEKTR